MESPPGFPGGSPPSGECLRRGMGVRSAPRDDITRRAAVPASSTAGRKVVVAGVAGVAGGAGAAADKDKPRADMGVAGELGAGEDEGDGGAGEMFEVEEDAAEGVQEASEDEDQR